MFLGSKKGSGHVILGNKKGPMMRLGMKGKTLSMLKQQQRGNDNKEKEKKSPLERLFN